MLSAKDVKSQLSVEDVTRLCIELGSEEPSHDNSGHPCFCTSICHGGDSMKLYYYDETKLFHCYTCGKTHDIFSLVQSAKHFEDFQDAFYYVKNFFGLVDDGFQEEKPELISDWDDLNKYEDYEKASEKEEALPAPIQENILEYFYPLAAPTEWLKDNISAEVMYYYGIRVDSALSKIIIPHRDINGHLIGIRGRTFNPIELDKGQKYMPVFIEKNIYAHPLGKNLYGLYENQETIRRLKKVLVCESEKSVMQCATMYGVKNCFCVATCGSNLTDYQIDLLLSLGVEEVILGYDREFQGGRGEKDTIECEQKLIKHVQFLSQYVNVYIIMDYDHLTNYKDSPTDHGREILEKLMKQKIHISTITNEKVKRRRK